MTTVLSVLVMVGAEAVSDLMGQGHHGVRLAGLHPVVDECHERRVIPENIKQVIKENYNNITSRFRKFSRHDHYPEHDHARLSCIFCSMFTQQVCIDLSGGCEDVLTKFSFLL